MKSDLIDQKIKKNWQEGKEKIWQIVRKLQKKDQNCETATTIARNVEKIQIKVRGQQKCFSPVFCVKFGSETETGGSRM